MDASITGMRGQGAGATGQKAGADGFAAMRGSVARLCPSERLPQFLKFCLVGGSGTVVDMAVLYLLADPTSLGLSITLSKICAAETALLNNFTWNELWTFRRTKGGKRSLGGIFRRLLSFNAICGAGILVAVLLLHLFHSLLGWNLYGSNLLAILIVTLWNFGMNARYS